MACDSTDIPIQHPDDYDYITFEAQTQKLITRANTYEDYDPLRHPATMGTFGYYDIADDASLTNAIFANDMAEYSTASGTWANSTNRRWSDYKTAKTLDFFAYMPYTDGATLKRTAADSYTLYVPFAMPSGAAMLSDTRLAPIVCATPENKNTANDYGHIVSMKFDQTLTAYRLEFMLGENMGAIRQFRITKVTLSGEIATACTISRSYKLTDSGWTADKIKWTDITRTASGVDSTEIPYVASKADGADNESKTLLIGNKGYTQWGADFYVIPDSKFMPTISVEYDVVMTAEDSSTVVTRKGVKSSIVLNKNNFSGTGTGNTATITPIHILIQPRYLYVLADDDAYTGHLLID